MGVVRSRARVEWFHHRLCRVILTTGRTGRAGAMAADTVGGRAGSIAVVFDRGAASAAEIIAAIPPIAPPPHSIR